MAFVSALISLIFNEFKNEFRSKATIFSTFLFLISSTYLSYMLFKGLINKPVWSAIYWLVFLFSALCCALMNANQQNRSRLLYVYQIVSSESFIVARIVFYALYFFTLGLLSLLLWTLLGIELYNPLLFIQMLFFQSIIFSGFLSLISFLSTKTTQGFALMSVLSFPILLPDLLIVQKLTHLLEDQIQWAILSKYYLALLILSLISVGLSVVLFPYIWSE